MKGPDSYPPFPLVPPGRCWKNWRACKNSTLSMLGPVVDIETQPHSTESSQWWRFAPFLYAKHLKLRSFLIQIDFCQSDWCGPHFKTISGANIDFLVSCFSFSLLLLSEYLQYCYFRSVYCSPLPLQAFRDLLQILSAWYCHHDSQ